MKGLPDPTVPLEERLPTSEINVEELTAFTFLQEQLMPFDVSWELSSALEHKKIAAYVPNVGPVWKS